MSQNGEDDDLLALFVQESLEHLETIEPNLLIMEEHGPDTEPEVINSLFRAVHSIKGSAGFFGLENITRLSHTMENLLGKARDRSILPSMAMSDSLLAGQDKLKIMIDDIPASEEVDATAEIAVFEQILNGGEESDTPEVHAKAPQEDTVPATPDSPEPGVFDLSAYPDAVAEAQAHGRRLFSIALHLVGDQGDQAEHLGNMRSMAESVGDIVAATPDILDPDFKLPLNLDTATLLFSTVLVPDLLQTMLDLPAEHIQEIALPEPAESAQPAPTVTGQEEPPPRSVEKPEPTRRTPSLAADKKNTVRAAAPTVEETLRVSVSLLDELINNAGELVLARNQLLRAAAMVGGQFPDLPPLVQNLDAITSRVQEKVMQVRMQPLSVVFNKFPRIVRDLARKLDKKIDLELLGGDVDLDKSVIEHLSDPLTHLIRNVADHGIETPRERVAAGKPETGKTVLSAYHESGMVNIALSDDGAGIDHDRLRLKAVEKGLITLEQAETMGDQEALMLIFAPGFSTAKTVSDVSGRGVGMDVVRTNIEKLGGAVHIEATLGKGTKITLKLPLTLAIIPAMIVSTAGQRFAIPEVGLVEIVRITESDRSQRIEMVGNAPVLRLRNTLLPLVNLADVLGLQRHFPPESDMAEQRETLADRRAHYMDESDYAALAGNGSESVEKRTDKRRSGDSLVAYIMVLRVANAEIGMMVEEVMDSEEIVVKPLPTFFKDNPCLSATTILGDGSVALIIDSAGVVESAHIKAANVEGLTNQDLDEDRRAALREKQNIVVLETVSGVPLGLVHGMIRRVEKISPDMLEIIGGVPYVRHHGKTIKAIYPEQVMGLEAMGYGAEAGGEGCDLYMVIPNLHEVQAGLIFRRILDTRETVIDLDCETIRSDGLVGTAHIDERVTLFPDVSTLIEMAGICTPGGDVPKGMNRQVLVVDDTPFLRAVTAKYLNGAGFIVDQAQDAKQALKLLKDKPYDLLVTDIMMPGMDGFDLAEEKHATRNAEIPVIAVSSAFSSLLEKRCRQAGFAGCVPSIDRVQLLQAAASV